MVAGQPTKGETMAFADLSHAAKPYLGTGGRSAGALTCRGKWRAEASSGGSLMVTSALGDLIAEVVSENPRDAVVLGLAPAMLAALVAAYEAHDADPDTKAGRERRAKAWKAFGEIARELDAFPTWRD